LLTSKEVLERTGISRATLNNYISWGVVPRPDVLPPEPQDGAAPRIGYFPEETVKRIEEIQRLKKEGWSITRIAEHFAAGPSGQPAPAAAEPTRLAPPPAPVRQRDPRLMPDLSFEEIAYPAYLVNDRFEVVWLNAAVSSASFSRLPADALSQGVFKYLLQSLPADTELRRTMLLFHLGLARQRGAGLADISRDLAPGDAAELERLYQEAQPIVSAPVAHAAVPSAASGVVQPLSVYAVQFREGVLFVQIPGRAGSDQASGQRARPEKAAAEGKQRLPALTQVAVLVAELQHADRLWAELSPEEYFELINQIWATVDPIFRRHAGMHGKHPGEGMVCYFVPTAGSDYLWNALAAAHQMREAMRRLSQEWQLRKGWSTELHMNCGIDEGQEWLGTFRSGAEMEYIVLGDAADRAARISQFSRAGGVWVTRNLLGKLRSEDRKRLSYGIRRPGADGEYVFVPSIFSRVEDLLEPGTAGSEVATDIARLSITEIVDIAGDPSAPDRNGRQPI
jgi:class 3 adenylate cyclase